MVDLFFTMTFFFSFLRSFSGNQAPSDVFLVVFRVFALPLQLQGPTLSEISPHMLKLGSSLTVLRSKIIFTKNQKQNNRHSLTCYAISFTLIDHSSRPISVRGICSVIVKLALEHN